MTNKVRKVEWLKASVKKAYYYYKRNGLAAAASAVLERLQQEAGEQYVYLPPTENELNIQRKQAAEWEDPILLSVVVPAYETPEKYLTELIQSLQQQTYPYWELILADASASDSVRRTVQECSAAEKLLFEEILREEASVEKKLTRETSVQGTSGDKKRVIRYLCLAENRGISENTNEAIRLAAGEYIGLLDHDDFLTPDALFEMACAIRKQKRAGVSPVFLYSDEDKCDGEGKIFYEPHRKLDFNADLLLTNNYVCHFTMMEARTLKKLLLRPEYDGAQDYDLVLRAAALLDETEPVSEGQREEVQTEESALRSIDFGIPQNRYVHIPRVLYHWRCHQDSTASNPQSKRYAYEAGKRALQDLAGRLGWQVEVSDTRHLGFYEMKWNPSILEQRKDIGAAAGPLPTRKGRLVSGIYLTPELERGQAPPKTCMLYEGLRSGFGGYLHRAELAQNVECADVRTMQVKPQYELALQQALREIESGADPAEVSFTFCRKLKADGMRILWNPQNSRSLRRPQ